MGCAPTARHPNHTPARSEGHTPTASVLTNKLVKDLSTGKMTDATYDKLLKLDIQVNPDDDNDIQIKAMDFANHEHLND